MKIPKFDPRSVRQIVSFLGLAVLLSGTVFAAGDILIHDKISPGALADSPLAGKIIRYEYHTGVLVAPNDDAEVDLISVGETVAVAFGEGTCTWLGLQGKFVGETATQVCGQAQIAPNVYFVIWLEGNDEAVSLVINLDAMTVNASFLHEGALEFLQATVHSFEDQE